MKKKLFVFTIVAVAFCAIVLIIFYKTKNRTIENLNRFIEERNAKNDTIQPSCLPPIEENLFYSFFEGYKLDTVSFEGTVRLSSHIPDPERNEYPNCLYTVFIELDSVLSSTPLSEKMTREAIVTIPVMKDKTILKQNIFLPGSKISCICSEYDAMPQNLREIQLSDDIQSFEHQQYYALSIVETEQFQQTGRKVFAKQEITILPILSLPKDEKAAALRQERIQKEIARIEEEMKEHGGSFAAWRKEYEPIAAKYNELCDKKYKAWIGDSYFSADAKETTYNTREYIDGMLPYKKYLEENNIDLILVRIPSKGDFAARVLTSNVFRENPDWVEHYYEFLRNDIEIVDPMPEMWEHRFDFPLFYYYNLETELHPYEGQAFITAKVLSEVLKRYSFPKSEQPIELKDFTLESKKERYFWPKGNPKFDPKKNVVFKQVLREGKTIGELAVNTGSPFLFLSNSWFEHPYRPNGASVPGYSAYFLQHIPDWLFQSGVHNQMIRNLVDSPEALQNRRAVIMVHTPRMNREGFPLFPKFLSKHVTSISKEKTLDFLAPEIKILDDGSFIFTKGNNGVTYFTSKNKKNAAKQFEIELTIPPCAGKTTCMLRICFESLSYLLLNVLDVVNGSVIDTTKLPNVNNSHSDLFIPVSDSERTVRIQFIPDHIYNVFSVKNIELWYF